MMMKNCFCGMVDRRKTFSLLFRRGHCQRSLPSQSPTHLEQVWTCTEPEFWLSWMKLYSCDNIHVFLLHGIPITISWWLIRNDMLDKLQKPVCKPGGIKLASASELSTKCGHYKSGFLGDTLEDLNWVSWFLYFIPVGAVILALTGCIIFSFTNSKCQKHVKKACHRKARPSSRS